MKEITDSELVELIDKAIKRFTGSSETLASAIGYLMIGRNVGWRVLYFMHSQNTVRKYEKILGIRTEDYMQEIGPLAKKAVAWNALQKVSNYWRAVRGEIAGVKSKELIELPS